MLILSNLLLGDIKCSIQMLQEQQSVLKVKYIFENVSRNVSFEKTFTFVKRSISIMLMPFNDRRVLKMKWKRSILLKFSNQRLFEVLELSNSYL